LSKSTLNSSVSTTLPWCFHKTALTSSMNFPVCLCKSPLSHLHTATASNVNLGHVDHMDPHLVDKILVLANSCGDNLDTIVYKMSCIKKENKPMDDRSHSKPMYIRALHICTTIYRVENYRKASGKVEHTRGRSLNRIMFFSLVVLARLWSSVLVSRLRLLVVIFTDLYSIIISRNRGIKFLQLLII
jgi:hypothetical protein